MSTAEGYVLPKRGIPKTLGILNIIFGVVMILAGFCFLGSILAYPAMMELAGKAVKDQQAKVEAQNAAQDKEFDDQEKAATTDEAKKAIKEQKDAAIAARPKVVTPDLNAAADIMKNPTIRTHQMLYYGTGVILSLVLMISGIGLVRLAPWGRSLAMTWAMIQILQVVLLGAYEAVVVNPVQQELSAKMLDKMVADAKAGNAAPGADAGVQAGKMMAGLAIPRIVGMSVLGCVYPAIVLILLSTAGARAACLPKKPEGPGPDMY